MSLFHRACSSCFWLIWLWLPSCNACHSGLDCREPKCFARAPPHLSGYGAMNQAQLPSYPSAPAIPPPAPIGGDSYDTAPVQFPAALPSSVSNSLDTYHTPRLTGFGGPNPYPAGFVPRPEGSFVPPLLQRVSYATDPATSLTTRGHGPTFGFGPGATARPDSGFGPQGHGGDHSPGTGFGASGEIHRPDGGFGPTRRPRGGFGPNGGSQGRFGPSRPTQRPRTGFGPDDGDRGPDEDYGPPNGRNRRPTSGSSGPDDYGPTETDPFGPDDDYDNYGPGRGGNGGSDSDYGPEDNFGPRGSGRDGPDGSDEDLSGGDYAGYDMDLGPDGSDAFNDQEEEFAEKTFRGPKNRGPGDFRGSMVELNPVLKRISKKGRRRFW